MFGGEEEDCDDDAASSTDRENEAASRIIDGTALYTVSSAAAFRSHSNQPIMFFAASSRALLEIFDVTIVIHGAALSGSVFCEGER